MQAVRHNFRHLDAARQCGEHASGHVLGDGQTGACEHSRRDVERRHLAERGEARSRSCARQRAGSGGRSDSVRPVPRRGSGGEIGGIVGNAGRR